jgi:DNA-binding MarR family transcriptional regulator
MAEIDTIIHQPVRLQIMASLVTLGPEEEVDFTHLRDMLEVTDGNLGAHIQKLEEAGYIKVNKTFVGRKPRTFLSASSKGRGAFHAHVDALRAILGDA